MSTVEGPSVLLRLFIEPEANLHYCSRCGKHFTSRILVNDLRRLTYGVIIHRGTICPECFALALVLDGDLEGGDDTPTWTDFATVKELLEAKKP